MRMDFAIHGFQTTVESEFLRFDDNGPEIGLVV